MLHPVSLCCTVCSMFKMLARLVCAALLSSLVLLPFPSEALSHIPTRPLVSSLVVSSLVASSAAASPDVYPAPLPGQVVNTPTVVFSSPSGRLWVSHMSSLDAAARLMRLARADDWEHSLNVALARHGSLLLSAPAPAAASYPASTTVGVSSVPAASVTSINDPYLARQWHLSRLGISSLYPSLTGSGVVVAVVDTGVDASHVDLQGQLLPGVSFSNGVQSDGAPDDNGHGTHVVGLVAAVSNNGLGVASVASGVKILPIKALDAQGSGYDIDIALGIDYAVDHGANIVNLSLGAASLLPALVPAIAYAHSHGVIIVCAAGNFYASGDPVVYPAAYDDTFAVAASTSSDAHAPYSEAGAYVDISAPGDLLYSTLPSNSYGYMSGTSMASPVAAASLAVLMQAHPSWSVSQLEGTLEASAVKLSVSPSGFDPMFGWGRVDLLSAVNQSVPLNPLAGPPSPNSSSSDPSTSPSSTPSLPSSFPSPSSSSPSSASPIAPSPTSSASTSPSSSPSALPSESLSSTPSPLISSSPSSAAPSSGPPSPTSPPHPTPALLVFSAPAAVTYGESVRLTAALLDQHHHAISSHAVSLFYSFDGVSYQFSSSHLSAANGAVSVLLKPQRSFYYYWSSLASSSSLAARTNPSRLRVMASLSLSSARSHRQVVLTVRSRLASAVLVVLARNVEGRWVTALRSYRPHLPLVFSRPASSAVSLWRVTLVPQAGIDPVSSTVRLHMR